MWQEIAIYLIGAAVVLYVARKIWRTFRRKPGGGCDCGCGCSGCSRGRC